MRFWIAVGAKLRPNAWRVRCDTLKDLIGEPRYRYTYSGGPRSIDRTPERRASTDPHWIAPENQPRQSKPGRVH